LRKGSESLNFSFREPITTPIPNTTTNKTINPITKKAIATELRPEFPGKLGVPQLSITGIRFGKSFIQVSPGVFL